MKNKILRTLLPSLMVMSLLGVLNATGQTFIVSTSGTLLSSPVQIKPIGPEPEPAPHTAPPVVPASPIAPASPVVPASPTAPAPHTAPMPVQPVVPSHNVPIGPEPEPASPPMI